MDMTEDVEEELEEFSRLRRIGHFKAARRYFEEHLESCIENAYVLDQYSQFLLEISDVHTLTKLAREYPAGDGQKAISASWVFICKRALQFDDDACAQNVWRKTPDLRKLLRNWPKLDSTELQRLTNNLRVVKSSLEASTEEYNAEEYGQLYAHLQHEDRIWDFRDLCYGLLAVKSLEGTIHCLFSKYLSTDNENAEDVIQVIQHHWEIAAGDEVTSLALLDIFTLFTMWALDAASNHYDDDSADNSEELQTAKMYLKIAHHYATEVLRQNPLNLKSRPYLQWVIVKVLVERNTDAAASWGQDALTRYLSNLRGEAQVSTGAFRGMLSFQDLIYYTPNQDEAPNWKPGSSISFTPEQEKAIHMVARNARELGDVLLEAACLQQLGYSSLSPEGYILDLCNLWRSVGNRSGLLRAYLYRYILKRSPDASNDLRSDLLEFGDAKCNIDLTKTRFMVLRALSTRSYEKEVYLERAKEVDDDSDSEVFDRATSPQYRNNVTIRSSRNCNRQASNQSSDSFSDDIAPDDTPWSVGSQRPELHHVGSQTLNKEATASKNVRKWLNEQPPRKRITESAFNEADQIELMPPQPTTNILPVRRHSTEISEDFEHVGKHTLGSDSGKMTEGSKDMEDIIDLVDDRDKQRREKEKNDDSDIGEIEVKNFESHVFDEEGNQEDVQSVKCKNLIAEADVGINQRTGQEVESNRGWLVALAWLGFDSSGLEFGWNEKVAEAAKGGKGKTTSSNT
ncbi:hypothetical protein CGCTS75_v013801 [Colletotrichum tropicale]|nr:hypothetical protein CGCTS75_v013801 [Colletotrichum tropicale]